LKPVLAVVTLTVIVIKGLSYALNNPTREIMYMPTSRDVRFKAKGWIDQFGARSSKAVGALVNNNMGGSLDMLFAYGSIISFGLLGGWFVVATYVGWKFTQLTDKKQVIE
jgi:AAA family ATP:ADP antiporter